MIDQDNLEEKKRELELKKGALNQKMIFIIVSLIAFSVFGYLFYCL